jgi:hypothetical protein
MQIVSASRERADRRLRLAFAMHPAPRYRGLVHCRPEE